MQMSSIVFKEKMQYNNNNNNNNKIEFKKLKLENNKKPIYLQSEQIKGVKMGDLFT